MTARSTLAALLASLLLVSCSSKKTEPSGIATVSYVKPLVKTKEAEKITWDQAYVTQSLAFGDRLQTFDKAAATLAIRNDQQIIVHENSLIVIGDFAQDTVNRTTRGEIAVSSGRIHFNSPEEGRTSVSLTYHTPNATIAAMRAPADQSDFDVLIQADSIEKDLFSVFRGKVKVSAQGDSVDVLENFGTYVNKSSKPAPPRPLPPVPTLLTPTSATFSAREIAQGSRLSWTRVLGATHYHLNIASDSSASYPIADTITSLPSALLQQLPRGTYYWRASAIDSVGIEGKASAPNSFRVLSRIFTQLRPTSAATNQIVALDTVVDGKLYAGGYVLNTSTSGVRLVLYALTDAWYAQGVLRNDMVIPQEPDDDGYWEVFSHKAERFKVLLVRKELETLPALLLVSNPPRVDGLNILFEMDFVPRFR